MNLSQTLDTTTVANAGSVMEVRDANGAPLIQEDGRPVTITLLGKDSDVFVKHEAAATNRRLAQGTRVKLTAEALKADTIGGLAKCTVAWDGIGIDEDATECTYENALRLYNTFPDIRDQVSAFVDDRANFSKASLKS